MTSVAFAVKVDISEVWLSFLVKRENTENNTHTNVYIKVSACQEETIHSNKKQNKRSQRGPQTAIGVDTSESLHLRDLSP